MLRHYRLEVILYLSSVLFFTIYNAELECTNDSPCEKSKCFNKFITQKCTKICNFVVKPDINITCGKLVNEIQNFNFVVCKAYNLLGTEGYKNVEKDFTNFINLINNSSKCNKEVCEYQFSNTTMDIIKNNTYIKDSFSNTTEIKYYCAINESGETTQSVEKSATTPPPTTEKIIPTNEPTRDINYMLNKTNDTLKKLQLFENDTFVFKNIQEFITLFNSTLNNFLSNLRNKTSSEMQTGVKNGIDVIERLDTKKMYTNDTSSATVLLESVGKIGSVLTDFNTDVTVSSSKKTITIKAGRMTKSDKQFVAEDTVTMIKVNTPAGATNASLIFTTINMTNVMATLFSNLTDPTAQLESNLIQATIYNRNDGKKISTGSTSTKIIMRLPFTASNDHRFALRKCVFFPDENPKNFESGEGCRAVPEVSTSSETVCECNHLTGFAVLMYPNQTWPDAEFQSILKAHQLSLNIVTYVCLGISILCLLMTNITYFVVKLKFQLQNKTIIRVHHSLCFMLMIAHILYLTGLERTENENVCKVMSSLIFYFYLSIFFWVFCESLMYTKSFIIVIPRVNSVIANLKFVHYCIIGYLGPLVVLAITIAIRHEHLIRYKTDFENSNSSLNNITDTNVTEPHITHPPATCWLSSEKGTIWAFIGPVFLICLFNLVVLGSIIVKLSRPNSALSQVKDKNKDFTDFLMRQLKLSFKLAILLGLTWLIGLFFAFSIPYPRAHLAMLYAFAILNGLQGAFIFFTQVFAHPRIRDGWAEFLLKHKRCLPESLRVYLERRHQHRLGRSSSDFQKHKKSSDQPSSRSGSGRIPAFINFLRKQFSSSSQRTTTSELLPENQQIEQSESNKRLLSEHEHQRSFPNKSDDHCMELKNRQLANIGIDESLSHSQKEPVVMRSNSNPVPPPLTTLPSSLPDSNDRLNIE